MKQSPKSSGNYRSSNEYNPQELNQSDFGHIFFNLPTEVLFPNTTEELANMLKSANKLGKPIKIRNTGHSVNGQTLTSGTQLNVSNLKKIHFDKEKLELTVGAGVSWDEMFKVIKFPKFCLPVFPNNPGQQIHVGGTAAVGGVGPTSSKYGGFWDNVVSLELVSMEGEIISCSREKNEDIFKYALAGFGRIGVIAELTLKVIPSKSHYLICFLPNYDLKAHINYIEAAFGSDLFDGVVAESTYFDNLVDNIIPHHCLALMTEIDVHQNPEPLVNKIKGQLQEKILLFISEEGKVKNMDLSLRPKLLPKRDIVYYYPRTRIESEMEICHPWSDYMLGKEHFEEFFEELIKQVKKSALEKFLIKQTAFHSLVDLPMFPIYIGKRVAKNADDYFPLTVDLPSTTDFVFGTGVFMSVPINYLPVAKKLTKTLTDLCYELGGKRYLYGFHELTKAQVEKHFGREVINTWQSLKDKLDPKHLLNIRVIEHLD